MSASDPRTWLDRALGACFGLLVGALAVYVAVRLLEAVWSVLLIILCVGLLLGGAVAILRARLRGW